MLSDGHFQYLQVLHHVLSWWYVTPPFLLLYIAATHSPCAACATVLYHLPVVRSTREPVNRDFNNLHKLTDVKMCLYWDGKQTAGSEETVCCEHYARMSTRKPMCLQKHHSGPSKAVPSG